MKNLETKFIEKNTIGYIGKKENNWRVRLCESEVLKNDKVAYTYFDLRNVKLDENNKVTMYGKGIALSYDELKELKRVLNNYEF